MSVLSGFVPSSYRNCADTFCIALTTVFLFILPSSPATAHGNPHDNPYPEWQNTSSQTYCSIYSSYLEQNKIIAHVGFNYWKQPYNLFPLQLQAYFPEILDYQKPTKMKIFYNNGEMRIHSLFTIDRFERSVWLKSNDEEIIINTLDDARLITVSAISKRGKEHIFKYSVNHRSFEKEKEWLFNCMERDKEYLKYLKKSLLKYL
jgi:hypothetical protein